MNRAALSAKRDMGHGAENDAAFYENALLTFLKELGWKGQKRDVMAAMPYGREIGDLTACRAVLANLGYPTVMRPRAEAKSYPILYWSPQNEPVIIRTPQEMDAAHEDHGKEGGVYLYARQSLRWGQNDVEEDLSVSYVARRFRTVLAHVFTISILIGVVAIAPVLYNLAVYDVIMPSKAMGTLPMLCAGIAMALAMEGWLRYSRGRMLSYFGARLEHVVGLSVMERLLFMPIHFTERSPVSSQVARLKDFDGVRDFFTGPLATLFFELPLILVYWCVMAVLAPPLALIPAVLIAAYGVLLLYAHRGQKEVSRRSANASSARQEFLLETFAKLRAIRLSGMEKIWAQRYEKITHETTEAVFAASFHAQKIEIASYVLMTLGGVATLGFGVLLVIAQSVTVGGLIASMILIWRVLAPLQMCCASVVRMQQLAASTRQIERLMSFTPEISRDRQNKSYPSPAGRVTFHRVSMRYATDTDPALLGVSFDIKPGQIVAIKGENGAGKSSILKLILGLYHPQGGSVRLDGIDIRQYDPVALRRSIAYVPQHVQLLPGTLRDNLLMANPTANDTECLHALDKACATEQVGRLSNGLDTILSGESEDAMSFLLLQRINLARAYLKQAKIILFDEASHSLGRENDEAFAAMLASLRGHSTVIMATHRLDHMMMADQLLALQKGELIASGSPEFVLASLRGKS